MNQFAQSGPSLQEIFDLIQETPFGQVVYGQFYALYKAGKLKIQSYPLALRSKLLAVQTPGCPLGAVFITDGEEGQILYEAEGKLGILVPFIFHEIIHSLDERIWKAAGKDLKPSEKEELIYSSECLAFSAQHEFQEGLKAIYPELRIFHRNQYPRLDFLNRAISPKEISKLYHLSEK
ncbi:MAG: hypothetical protein ABI041_13415 [Bdellovibrionia bacterium]